MIIDEIELFVEAGKGGAGKVSFGPGMRSGPDGGNGGRGGDVYIKVTSDLGVLNRYCGNRIIKAENGIPGDSRKMYGRDGKDTTFELPIGSIVENLETGEKIELDRRDEVILIAKGGLGGRGNFEFRSPTNTTPTYAQPGLKGERKNLKVNLKFMAEFGIVGLPNAGKSSLLNAITNSNARIGNYPFTTLEPNLGVFDGHVIADIPGLIEGASQGKGLGTRFLKHVSRVKILIHCISAENEDPEKDYRIIINELKAYDDDLGDKKQIIAITKSDLSCDKRINKMIKKLMKFGHKIVVTTTNNASGVQSLTSLLSSSVVK